MNRIDARFAALRERGRCALIPYITAGHPTPAATVPSLHALVRAGADLIELGVPFSDPMADGPIIQAACEKALAHNVGLRDILAWVSEFRTQDNMTPIILMGYMNPLERFGSADFIAAAAVAGVDGILIVDLPPEESSDLESPLAHHNLHQIYLVAPTTTKARRQRICQQARGFVYYVSLKGVTGAGHLAAQSVNEAVSELKTMTKVPVGVGFGIKTAADVQRLAGCADAVVVGSALVSAMDIAGDTNDAATVVGEFLAPLRAALDVDAHHRHREASLP